MSFLIISSKISILINSPLPLLSDIFYLYSLYPSLRCRPHERGRQLLLPRAAKAVAHQPSTGCQGRWLVVVVVSIVIDTAGRRHSAAANLLGGARAGLVRKPALLYMQVQGGYG